MTLIAASSRPPSRRPVCGRPATELSNPAALKINPGGAFHSVIRKVSEGVDAAELRDWTATLDTLVRCRIIERNSERYRMTQMGKAVLSLLDGGATIEADLGMR